MAEYKRKYPEFSLCGLNCCLCPRYHTEGSSRCPGCGGDGFTLCHPSCSVISCNKKHDNVEFCFECSAYPCKKYEKPSEADSFISYRNVLKDQASAKVDLMAYINDIHRKSEILNDLIANFNDGKSKGFYCLAVNLLPLSALEGIVRVMHTGKPSADIPNKKRAEEVKTLIMQHASDLRIDLVLRK